MVRTVNSILQALIISERGLEQKVVLMETVDAEKRNGVAIVEGKYCVRTRRDRQSHV
jgi:hypothetical protein